MRIDPKRWCLGAGAFGLAVGATLLVFECSLSSALSIGACVAVGVALLGWAIDSGVVTGDPK